MALVVHVDGKPSKKDTRNRLASLALAHPRNGGVWFHRGGGKAEVGNYTDADKGDISPRLASLLIWQRLPAKVFIEWRSSAIEALDVVRRVYRLRASEELSGHQEDFAWRMPFSMRVSGALACPAEQ